MHALPHPFQVAIQDGGSEVEGDRNANKDFFESSRRVETALDEDSSKAVLRSSKLACLVIVCMWHCRIGHTLELPVAETREPYDAGKAARVAGSMSSENRLSHTVHAQR